MKNKILQMLGVAVLSGVQLNTLAMNDYNNMKKSVLSHSNEVKISPAMSVGDLDFFKPVNDGEEGSHLCVEVRDDTWYLDNIAISRCMSEQKIGGAMINAMKKRR